ncbi:MAG: hypothetical protein D3926_15960 [Desulfobacteraceae bacterium]|nr:MAG: hypothetical protein D3926_15960 [Desulfobacteraceae bacterium]
MSNFQKCNYLLLFIVIISFAGQTMTGCVGTSYYDSLDNEYKKDPTHIQNVPASGPTAIDGVWYNPTAGLKVSIIQGREVNSIQLSSSTPVFPSVSVRDIKMVAPGRYRGLPVFRPDKYSHVSYSILGENKMLARWHDKTGEKMDMVYDRVKLSYPTRYLNEYRAFLKESEVEKSGIVIHKVYTNPKKIIPGIGFELVIDYTVTDSDSKSSSLPIGFNLDILQSKVSVQVSSGSSPPAPTMENSRKVHSFEPLEINCTNGKKSSKSIQLRAAKQKGSYYLLGRLNYKNYTKEFYIYFSI